MYELSHNVHQLAFERCKTVKDSGVIYDNKLIFVDYNILKARGVMET